MPASGETAPARMLVAVRAIAPVAGRPPNSAEPRLAAPWATSSQFDLCLRPVMPSATTAHSRLSTPARKAIVNALGTSSRTWAQSRCGSRGIGSVLGSSPKRLPIVVTGRSSRNTASEAPQTAIRKPGHFGAAMRRPTMVASAAAATARAVQFTE